MTEIDWDYWGYWIEHEVWPLEGACKVVYREKDPHINSPREVFWNPDIPSRPPWVKLFHQAQESFRAGTLRHLGPTLEFDMDGVRSEDVVAAEFLAWAQVKGVTIPPELKELLPRPATSQWEGFDPDSDIYPPELDIALQAWRAATNQRDPSKTAKEQIREWLDNYCRDLSKGAKQRIAVVCNWDKVGGRRRRE